MPTERLTPEELKIVHAWVVDLYTTSAKQSKYVLYNNASHGYCCLGRLCVVTKEEVDLPQYGVPRKEFHPLAFSTYKKLSDYVSTMTKDGDGLSTGFTSMNDVLQLSFSEIADIIVAILVEHDYPLTGITQMA